MTNHRCGGELRPAMIKIRKRVGVYYQNFTVEGLKCEQCGDEIISRETALEIEKTSEQLKRVWKDWRVPASTKITNVREKIFIGDTNVKV